MPLGYVTRLPKKVEFPNSLNCEPCGSKNKHVGVDVVETELLAFLIVVTPTLDSVIARMVAIAASTTAMATAVPISVLYSANPSHLNGFGKGWYLLLFFSKGLNQTFYYVVI